MLKLDGPLVGIGDVHAPFTDRRWLKWTYSRIKEVQPAYVVQVGDLYDQYSFARFPHTVDIMTPAEEMRAAREMAEEMWSEVRNAAPKAKLYQIAGNHCARASKRLFEKAPELRTFVDFKKPMTFPGVTTEYDDTAELFLGDLCVMHGFRSRLGDHARHNQCSTLVGHSHTGGVVYLRNRQGTFFELNAGYGGDPESVAFRYRAQKNLHNWTLGLAVIDEHGPRFSPFY